MKAKTKSRLWHNFIEFLKLQAAGNILFWGTYLGNAYFDQIWGWASWQSLAVASILAHVAFFVVDKNWVFSDKTGQRKTSNEVVRFIIFMGFNYFLNIGIILGLERFAGVSPYVGQFISAFFFTFWQWFGLKFWVFRHVRHAHHAGITIEANDYKAKRHIRYRRLETKQKAKRAARVYR